ncbi:hypothetical protein AX16_010909 [Volvariella volvacea WC 439]|nr:hypothetical protein AX16_010909 [Volvariella volvacea WC 439]
MTLPPDTTPAQLSKQEDKDDDSNRAKLLANDPKPAGTYDGGYSDAKEVRLRIANGGAGQSGLIGAWANAFIQYRVKRYKDKPFKVEWYLGDTTESLDYLARGIVDVAVTYNVAAENRSIKSGDAVKSVYGFRDHFYLVGPPNDRAGLDPEKDDILDMFSKIVRKGNEDAALNADNPVRFLSRFDKSATNIKESELFVKIGQVPWALAYSKWYHQYPRFPIQALEAAALLGEYTITDRGTWLSSDPSVVAKLKIYKEGGDTDPNDLLLNPAHALLGAKAKPKNKEIWTDFMDWVLFKIEDVHAADPLLGGQNVIDMFKKPPGPTGQRLYSESPKAIPIHIG